MLPRHESEGGQMEPAMVGSKHHKFKFATRMRTRDRIAMQPKLWVWIIQQSTDLQCC